MNDNNEKNILENLIKNELNKAIGQVNRAFDKKISYLEGKKELLRDVIIRENNGDIKRYGMIYFFLLSVLFLSVTILSFIFSPVLGCIIAILMFSGAPVLTELLMNKKIKTRNPTREDKKTKIKLIKEKEIVILNELKRKKVSKEIKNACLKVFNKEVDSFNDIIEIKDYN